MATHCRDAWKPCAQVLGWPIPTAVRSPTRVDINATAYDAISGTQQYVRLNQAVEARKFEIPIAAEFPLADAAQAHQRIEAGHVLAKIILRVR